MQTQKRAKRERKKKKKNQFWSSENDWRVVETNPPLLCIREKTRQRRRRRPQPERQIGRCDNQVSLY